MALSSYGSFWIEQGKNLESVEEMADIAAAALGASKDVPSYYLTQVAGIYAKLGKTEKALALYGPGFAKKSWDDSSALNSYASFWSRQDKNLDSAVEAAKRSVELKAEYYNCFISASALQGEEIRRGLKALRRPELAAGRREVRGVHDRAVREPSSRSRTRSRKRRAERSRSSSQRILQGDTALQVMSPFFLALLPFPGVLSWRRGMLPRRSPGRRIELPTFFLYHAFWRPDMNRAACFLILLAGPLLSVVASGQNAAPSSQSLDGRVREFLASQKGQWRQENVTETDGRLLHDLILKRGYTRALEIGTSTGHSGIWQAWALSKTGGSLVTVEIDEFRHLAAVRNFKSSGLDAYRRPPRRRPYPRQDPLRSLRLHLHRRDQN
jgi:hypothetical protein